jgi:hypothetical protein
VLALVLKVSENRQKQASMQNSKVLHKKMNVDLALLFLCICFAQKVEGKMAVFGYARVSTDVQSLASQDAQLRGAGCCQDLR